MGNLQSVCECIDENPNKPQIKSLEKINETNDGLDIYLIKYSSSKFKCPICSEEETDEELEKISNENKNITEIIRKINELIGIFNYQISYSEDLDFYDLESKENEIQNYYSTYKEHMLYKYTCQNNHQFYLRFFLTLKYFRVNEVDINPLERIEDKRYLSENLKKNEELKQELIKERKLKFKKERYKRQYLEEFKYYCYKKEEELIKSAIDDIEYEIDFLHKIDHSISPLSLLTSAIIKFDITYYWNQMFLLNYLEKLFNENIFNQFCQGCDEKEEFEEFVRQRVGEDYD